MDMIDAFNRLVHLSREERHEAIGEMKLAPGEQLQLWEALEEHDRDPEARREQARARQDAAIDRVFASEPVPEGLSRDQLIDAATGSWSKR